MSTVEGRKSTSKIYKSPVLQYIVGRLMKMQEALILVAFSY